MSDTEALTVNEVYRWSDAIDLAHLSLNKLIGEGYDEFWNWRGRYLVCKGSRASKKSYTTAYKLILGLLTYPDANILVVRKVADTNRDSTYALLCKVIYRLGLQDHFKMNTSPLEIVYKYTGQKILFRGLDDPLKLSSVQVTVGVLCWEWVEEAYQINNEKDFDLIDQSIRGEMPPGLYPQIILTFNPWHKGHWLKSRFFDNPDNETLAITTNYMCNEWLSDYDKKFYNLMKERSPRLYQTAGLGEWGISEGVIFDNWEEKLFNYMEISKQPGVTALFGLDFGYTNDPTAFVAVLVNEGTREMWIFDELYQKALDNEQIAKRIISMGYGKERIIYDCAEPKSGYEIKKYGLTRVYPSIKGADSVENGIQRIQHYHVYIHPNCVNAITEFENYAYDIDKMGKLMNKPIDDFNHIIDALRYCLIDYMYRHGNTGGVYKPRDKNTVKDDTMPPTERNDWRGMPTQKPRRVF